MCYEFAHPCDDVLLQKIGWIAGHDYFLVCIGNLNYLFSDNKEVIEKIRGLLFLESVVLHFLPDAEMEGILTFEETIEFQKFHGNKLLFESFIGRNVA